MSSQSVTSRHAALNVLGIEDDATEQEIIKAYRKAALRTHPDKPSGSASAFLEVQQAYTFLIEPTTDAPAPPTTFEDLIANLFKEMNIDPATVKVTATPPTSFPKKKAALCRFWNGTYGSCRNGDACKFRHPTNRCNHFNRPGGCKFGDYCNNLHKFN
jgi:hypothetical protein